LALKVVFGKLLRYPSCVPNLQLQTSTVAEISRGVRIFLDAPVDQTTALLGQLTYSEMGLVGLYAVRLPNMKLLVSTVAEIKEGPQIFWMLP